MSTPQKARFLLLASALTLSVVGGFPTSTEASETVNGRPSNGRPTNGRPSNGRPSNGLGIDELQQSFIWGDPNTFDFVFRTPWNQASFDAYKYSNWYLIMCHDNDAIDMQYLFRTGLGPKDAVDWEYDCNYNGAIEDNERIKLRGNLGYAPALADGKLLYEPDQQQRLSNIMMLVSNNARSPDDGGVIHNQLRSSSAFDRADSNATEAFPYYRGTATYVSSVAKSCPSSFDRKAYMIGYGIFDLASYGGTLTETNDPDCGYQIQKSRAFRVAQAGSTIRIYVKGTPTGIAFLRISKGIEAGDRSPEGTVSASYGTQTHYGLVRDGAFYYVTLPSTGLYNITWTARTSYELENYDWSNLLIDVRTYSGNVLFNDLDIFNLRESLFYSRDGGIFNLAHMHPTLRNCRLAPNWVYGRRGWKLGDVTYDVNRGTYGTCSRVLPRDGGAMDPTTGTPVWFDNTFQAVDWFWNSRAADLFKARSCSAIWNSCTAQMMGVANYNGTADYKTSTSPYWSAWVNKSMSTPSNMILGDFAMGYFPYDYATGWTNDLTDNGITSFLTDACARSNAYNVWAPATSPSQAACAELARAAPASRQ